VFISYLTSAANDICKEARRQTISAEDVFTALQDLDFGELITPTKEALDGGSDFCIAAMLLVSAALFLSGERLTTLNSNLHFAVAKGKYGLSLMYIFFFFPTAYRQESKEKNKRKAEQVKKRKAEEAEKQHVQEAVDGEPLGDEGQLQDQHIAASAPAQHQGTP
jgi:hypothetical protein